MTTRTTSPAAPGNAWPAGHRLGPYELVEAVSRRSGAIVYRAWDHALQRPVAVKEYLPARLARRNTLGGLQPASPEDALAFESGRRAFVDEARLLARCDHPSLLRVLALLELDGTAYRVMPWLDATPLSALRPQLARPPDGAALRRLADDLLGALEAWQAATGTAHGALDPGQVLLLEDDRALLLGPGLARRETASSAVEALMRELEPAWAAPEQLNPSPGQPLGPWTDFHALATTLRFALTGEAPPPAGRPRPPLQAGTIERLYAGEAPPRGEDDPLLRALETAAAPAPQERPQTAQEFRELLAGALRSNAPVPGAAESAVGPPSVAAPEAAPEAAEEAPPEADPAAPPNAPPHAAAAAPPAAPQAVPAPPAAAPVPSPAAAAPPLEPMADDAATAEVIRSVLAAIPDAPPRAPPAPRFPPPSSPPSSPPSPPPLAAPAPPHAQAPATVPMRPADPAEPQPVAPAHGARRRWAGGAAVLMLLLAAGATYEWWPAKAPALPATGLGAPPAGLATPAGLAAPALPPVMPAPAAPALPPAPPGAAAPAAELAAPPPAAPAAPPPAEPPSLPAPAPAAPLAAAPAPTAAAPVPARPARSPSPRELCGKRSDFALYRCFAQQCARPALARHPQCVSFKRTDQVPD